MKPTVSDVILCLQKIVDSNISSNSEIYAASSGIRRPEIIRSMLSLKYQTDYPVWYYASLLIKNLAGVTADLRLYTIMMDDPSKLYVNCDGVLITDFSESNEKDLESLSSVFGGELPWAYDWTITRVGEGVGEYSVKIHAVHRTSSNFIPPNTIIH